MDVYCGNSDFEAVLNFKRALENSVVRIENEIEKYPCGKLNVVNTRNYSQWRISTTDKDTINLIKNNKWGIAYDNKSVKSRRITAYLPKDNVEFARGLVRREILEKEKLALGKMLMVTEDWVEKNPEMINGILVKASKQKILDDRITELKNYYDGWMRAEYIKNPAPITIKYTAKNGVDMRSKSERFIADMLIDYKLPFLYEPWMMANGNQHYPDFVIINPLTRKVYVWEHNGLMDDTHYVYKVEKRFRDYSLEGFLLGDDLIFTSEMLSRPLKYEDVENNILRIVNDSGDTRNEKWDFDKWNKMVHEV